MYTFLPAFPTRIVNHVYKYCRPHFLKRGNVKVKP